MPNNTNIYVEIPKNMILNPSIFDVNEHNIISYQDEDEQHTFDFFNNESYLRKLLKIKLIKNTENDSNLVSLDISIAKAREICQDHGLPITFEFKNSN